MGTLSHQPASSKEKPSRDLLMNLTDILTLSVTFMPFCDPDKALPPSGWWMQEIFILPAALQRLILSYQAQHLSVGNLPISYPCFRFSFLSNPVFKSPNPFHTDGSQVMHKLRRCPHDLAASLGSAFVLINCLHVLLAHSTPTQ